MNYSELVTQVNDYCENSFPTVNMDVFIRQAEQRIYNTAQPANLRKNVTGILTVGNKYLQCPSDFCLSIALPCIRTTLQLPQEHLVKKPLWWQAPQVLR